MAHVAEEAVDSIFAVVSESPPNVGKPPPLEHTGQDGVRVTLGVEGIDVEIPEQPVEIGRPHTSIVPRR